MFARKMQHYANRPMGIAALSYTPIPISRIVHCDTYLLDSLTLFLSLIGFSLFCFNGMHPQPHPLFFSAILITSFPFKRLSNHLTIWAKKIARYLIDFSSLTLCCTVSSSFLSSFSYSFRAFKSDRPNSTFRYFPDPWHPHVQTSFNICRQFSIAFSSIEYGIQYPFLSLLTSPACFNIFRCWDTAAVVIPISVEMSLAPKGPWALSNSSIFTRVSTLSTLNISEGSVIMAKYLI